MTDEELLDLNVRRGRCACGKASPPNVSPRGDLRRRIEELRGVPVVVLRRKYGCNLCGHVELATTTVPQEVRSQ